MKSTAIALLAITFVVFIVANTQALRQHGQPAVGLANVNVRPRSYSMGSRIVGGENAGTAFAPWQVTIQNHLGNHFCGGAIIDDQWILTAGNCVAGLQKKNIKVHTGLNSWMGACEYCVYSVDQIITHCNFDKPIYHNDIALIKLSTSIRYDETTKKIPIAQEDLVKEGDKLTMTGWGSLENGGDLSEDLQKLEVNYMPYELCKFKLGFNDDVDIGHLCTFTKKGEGACRGDTGGPLVNEDGELVGIGNWGMPCGEGYPDVFARVAFYNDWIRTTIKGCAIPR